MHTFPLPFAGKHHRAKRKDHTARAGVRRFYSESGDDDSIKRWTPDVHSGDKRSGRAVIQPPKEELMNLVAMYASLDTSREHFGSGRDFPPAFDAPFIPEPTELDKSNPQSGDWDPLEPVHELIGDREDDTRTADSADAPEGGIDFMDNIIKDHGLHDSVLHNLWQFRRVLEEPRGQTSNEALFELYRRLPAPRASYLSIQEIRTFLGRLMWNKRPTEVIMVRYLSVLDDMKASNINIKGKEWNHAIHLTGRFTGKVEESDVESALHMWKEMEQGAGVRTGTTSFNILFDLASKAKKFALANVILKEMNRRQLQFDRSTRMALIYYNGMRRDGDGVRHEYASMVAAGEIIDTSVLNNVIVSLIHAGEPSTAEQTFERMKRLHTERAGATLPPHGWESSRQLHKILTQAAERWRDNPEARSRIQEAAPFAPDITTYRTLIEYHACDAGNFDRTFSLIEEMGNWGYQPDGPIFYWLLSGFFRHGGVRYSSWTCDQLEQIWAQFLMACEERPDETELAHGIAAMAVRAFAQCADLERAREVWDDIKMRWTPSEETFSVVHKIFLKKRESTSLAYSAPSRADWWRSPIE